jgi:hypothetical protein
MLRNGLGRRRLLLALVGTAILPGAVAAQSGMVDAAPEAVVRELLAAMAANDAARIRASFAPSASQAYGDGRAKSGDAFSAWLKSDIIDRHGQVINPRLAVSGSEVVVTGQFRNNAGYTSAANFLIKVEGGKITSWQMRY